MKIGLYGGTFNPPHQGHRRMADAFLQEIKPDKMLIVPNKRPVHKICEDLALDYERVEMCRRAFPESAFHVSEMEIQREKESYTLYTVEDLKAQYPDAELYLLMGSDMFLSFHKWYHYQEILEACTLCVASREDEISKNTMRSYAFQKLHLYLRGEQDEKVRFLPLDPLEVSSSELREKIQNGEDTGEFLAPEVLSYIKERKMYGYREKR